MISLTKSSTYLLKRLRKALLARTFLVCLKFPRTPCQHGKKHKEKTYENYERRAKPQKYEAVNKAVMKRLLIMRSDNIPINEPMFKEKAHKFPEQLNLEDFHASNGWLKKLEKGYTDLRLSNFLINTL